jgi:uncharacterized protein YjbI with pentapeptide repeats
LDDLRFAAELQPFGEYEALEFDGDYDRLLFAGRSFGDGDGGAAGARFTECAFTDGTGFDGTRLRRSRWTDVWLAQSRLVSVDLAESSLTDTWFNGCVFAGVQAFSLAGRRVLLQGCKLDSVNFRDSRLNDITFADCVLREVDFGSAKLARARFAGSTLVNVDFTNASCKDVDLRGARLGTDETPGIKGGFGSLAGARIDHLQLMTLAPHLAHHLGIKVTD